ncbi:MAG: GNAT family N-acetyltransferase [Pirellulaceae bacterium]
MKSIVRTDSSNPDFRGLVALLDQYLGELDGPEHSFYAQYNKLDAIQHVVVGYADGVPAACGAFKFWEEGTVEIKRMFTHPDFRRQGWAEVVLGELERWASAEGFPRAVLETGHRQQEAVRLYERLGYGRIPNYGQYAGVANSICMAKALSSAS